MVFFFWIRSQCNFGRLPKQVATLVPLEAGNESGRLCILPGLGQFAGPAGPAGPAGCDFKRKIPMVINLICLVNFL